MKENTMDDSLISHLATLVLGGGGMGGVWAWAAQRKEKEADRIARFEDRLIREVERMQKEHDEAMIVVKETRDAYYEERQARTDATRDLVEAEEKLVKAEQKLGDALARVKALETSEAQTREVMALLGQQNKELIKQNGLLKSRLREHGDELGGSDSDVVEVVK